MTTLRSIFNLQFLILKRLKITKLNIKNYPAKSRGVTLVELTVATSVIALLIVLVMTFLVDKYVENAIANARADLQQQTQITLDIINRDLKVGGAVDSQNRWADGNSPGSPANNFSWQSDGDTLVLATPVQNSSQNIIYEDPNTYISYKNDFVYFLQNGSLYKRTLAAPVGGNVNTTTCPPSAPNCPDDIKLADNIASFDLDYFDANETTVSPANARSVGVNLRVSRNLYGKTIAIEETIRTVLRND